MARASGLALAALLLLPAVPRAQTRAPADLAVQAVRLLPGESIPLDGTLAHPAWQRAPAFDAFVENMPVRGGPPPQRTSVQVLFDQRALYIGIRAHDEQPERIRDVPVRADGVNRTQDFVVAYVDPIGSRRAAQFFRVNAAGSTADGLHTAADDAEDFAPDFDWDAAVARHERGWSTVIRLPFASLRYADAASGAAGTTPWRFMVARRIPREQFHLVTSVDIPRDAGSFISALQPLVGVELPADASFLTLRPSLTLRGARERDPAGAVRTREGADASLDIKWRPNAQWVLDATLNPDFSQIALDVPQLAGNQRFALFVAEKRPFFLESFDLLRSPTDALYTRTFTEPRWGLRSTLRGSAWAGTAFAIDDRGGGLVLLPGPYGTGVAEQPAARSLSARLRDDGDGALHVGALMALRRYRDEGGIERGDNAVFGPDAELLFGGPWRARMQWLHSKTSALDDGAGSLARGPGQDADRALVRLTRNTGLVESTLLVDHIGRGFRHDGGFVGQSGVRRIEFFQGFGWERVGPFNEFFVNVDAVQVRDLAGGAVVQEVIRPGLWSSGASNLEWSLDAFIHSRQRTAAGRALLAERYLESRVVVTPARWFSLLETTLAVGRLADTVADQVREGARWNVAAKLRPVRPLELEPSLSWAVLRDDGTSRYRESALQLLAVWHFDARQTLRAIVQRRALDRRAEPGVGATRDRGGAESLTYAWRQSSGTVLYAGASGSHGNAEPRVAEAFVKLQFDIDELRSAWRTP